MGQYSRGVPKTQEDGRARTWEDVVVEQPKAQTIAQALPCSAAVTESVQRQLEISRIT